MGKKNAFVTTIGFNKNDPAHVQVAEFLNGMERGKAQYIVNAVLAYQSGAQAGDMTYAGQAVDYEKIRQFVLQVISEHERQQALRKETAGEPAGPDAAEERDGATFGFNTNALDEIIYRHWKRSRDKIKGSLQDIFTVLAPLSQAVRP